MLLLLLGLRRPHHPDHVSAVLLQVKQYILVTADHHHLDGDDDCDVFVDADLSILVSCIAACIVRSNREGWQQRGLVCACMRSRGHRTHNLRFGSCCRLLGAPASLFCTGTH